MTEKTILTLKLKPRDKSADNKISVVGAGKGKTVFIPKKPDKKEAYTTSAPSVTFSHKPKKEAQKKIESKNKYKLALRQLESVFPKVFNLLNPKPLSIGIREELLALEQGVSNKQIRMGLFFYCNSHQYLCSVKEGVRRVNATGRYTKEVTKEEEQDAKKRLRELFTKIRESR